MICSYVCVASSYNILSSRLSKHIVMYIHVHANSLSNYTNTRVILIHSIIAVNYLLRKLTCLLVYLFGLQCSSLRCQCFKWEKKVNCVATFYCHLVTTNLTNGLTFICRLFIRIGFTTKNILLNRLGFLLLHQHYCHER